MLNRSASLALSTSVLKALPGKLDIKRHSPSTVDGIRPWTLILSDDVKSLVNKNDSVTC